MDTMLHKHICIECNKSYASYNSLWNHKKRYHITTHKSYNSHYDDNNTIYCEYCSKIFTHRQNKHRHIKSCSEKTKFDEERILDNAIKQAKIEQKKIQLNNITNNITNSNNNSNNTNYITYNFNSEQDKNRATLLLDDATKMKLMLSSYCDYIPKLIEMIYCGDYIQFKNVLIKNLKSNFVYIYKDGKFIAEEKELILNTLLENNYWNIESIVKDLANNNEINTKTLNKIETGHTTFNQMYENDDTFYDNKHNVKYKNFKEYNKQRVLLLLFNSRDKIKEQCALFSDNQLTEEEMDVLLQKKIMLEEDAGY